MKQTIILSVFLVIIILTSCTSGKNLSCEASGQKERAAKTAEFYEIATTKIKFGAGDERTANLLKENPDLAEMLGDSFFFVCDSDFAVEKYNLSSKLAEEEKSKIKLMKLEIEIGEEPDVDTVVLCYFENFTFDDMMKYNSIGLTVKDGMYHFMFYPVEAIDGTKDDVPDFYSQFEKVTLKSAQGECFDVMFCPYSYIEQTAEDRGTSYPIREWKVRIHAK